MRIHAFLLMSVAAGSSAALVMAGLATAGDLEPPAPPAPTMKTLDEIPGSWHRLLDSTNGDVNGCDSDRFKCVMNGSPVLDLETGLVWQKGPSAGVTGYPGAKNLCLQIGPATNSGGRHGWRLASVTELLTLRDENQGPPYLPAGHPFVGIAATDEFWTADSITFYDGTSVVTHAYIVAMDDEGPPGVPTHVGSIEINPPTDFKRWWCVRGPSPESGGY